ncbi:MAG TPA: ATP-binding cassette domain-containing protein, partial [Pyrinomonadaceae bacterium]
TKVQIGYYAQQLDDLDDRNEIIMELRRVAPSNATAGELRSFLAKFLFTGDDVYKHVRDLSGGEKGRLALAKLIYSRVNVLVLDEPTNHLDIPSREALEEALSAYEGTIVTISHDRYFLDKVATQILALDGAGHAEHYEGDYTEYHDWKASSSGRAVPAQISPVDNLIEPILPPEPTEPQIEEVKKPSGKKSKTAAPIKPIVKVIKKKKLEIRTPETIESEIGEAEKRMEEVSEKMGLPEVARDPQQLIKLDEEYREVESRLKVLYEEWETAAAQKTG